MRANSQAATLLSRHSARPVRLACLPLMLLMALGAFAQQPSTQTAPIYAVNSQYVQGVGPGFWPTAGAGLVLNLASGTSFCNGATTLYAGGSLTLTANTTNYVYLDPVACLPVFNTTGFPPGAAPLATVLTTASGISGLNDSRTWFVSSNVLSSMVNAASFSGSAGAQIDGACSSLNGKSGAVVIPASIGAGQSLAGLANGCAVLDLRGAGPNLTSRFAPNEQGDEGQLEAKYLFRERILLPQPVNSVSNQFTGYFYQEPWTGGVNTLAGGKSNYAALATALVRRTPGQGAALAVSGECFAQGDCEPLQVTTIGYGDQNAGGDEGAVTFRGNVFEGTAQFQATVTSVSGSSVNYSGAVNEDLRGESRLLLDLTKADTRGSVTAISGTPAVVTATGTLFATNHGGTGAKTSLCFELAGSAGGYNNGTSPFHDVYPVASVQSDTQLTLNLVFEGVQGGWFGDVTAGTPTVYPCSTVSSLGLSGSVNVADGSQFSTGDSILEAIGHQFAAGLFIVGNWSLPMPGLATFATFTNLSNRPWWGGLSVRGNFSNNLISFFPHSGPGSAAPSTGLSFVAGDWRFGTDLIDVGDTGTNTNIRLIGVNRNSGGNAYFSYFKGDDAFNFNGGAEISADGRAAFGVSAQSGWQTWIQPSGTNNGLTVNMPGNSSASVLDVAYGGVPALSITGNGANGSNWTIADGPLLSFYSDNLVTLTASISGATGNAVFNNLPPVYSAAGTAQTGSKLHIVEDQVTLASGAATVTLTGSAAFSSASSYKCGASDQTSASAVKVAYASASQFAVSGTGSDVISFVCVGN